jgi:AhpD family alkylhydroperoxidase
MNRITPLDPNTSSGAAKDLFDGVQAKLGVVPNLFRVLGNAPAALTGYLDFGAALGKGAFDAKLREQIALAVAESNQCGYCLSAHTFVGRKVGLTDQQIADARHANAEGGRN